MRQHQEPQYYPKSPEIEKQLRSTSAKKWQAQSLRATPQQERQQTQTDETAQILAVFQKRRYQVEEIIKFHILNQKEEELNAEKVLRDDLQSDIKNLLHRYPSSQQPSPTKNIYTMAQQQDKLMSEIKTVLQNTKKLFTNLGYTHQNVQNLLARLQDQIIEKINNYFQRGESPQPGGIYQQFEEQKNSQSLQRENQMLKNNLEKLQQNLTDVKISIEDKNKQIRKLSTYSSKDNNSYYSEIIEKQQAEIQKLNSDLNEIKKLYELKLNFCDELLLKLKQPPEISPRVMQISPRGSQGAQQRYGSPGQDYYASQEQYQRQHLERSSDYHLSHQNLLLSSYREENLEGQYTPGQMRTASGAQSAYTKSMGSPYTAEKQIKGTQNLTQSEVQTLRNQQEVEFKAAQNLVKVQKLQQMNYFQKKQIQQLKDKIEKLEEDKLINDKLYKEKLTQFITSSPEHQNQELEEKLLQIIDENKLLQEQLLQYKTLPKSIQEQSYLQEEMEELVQALQISQAQNQELTEQLRGMGQRESFEQ